MKKILGKVIQGSTATVVCAFILQHSDTVLAYDGKNFNSLFDKGQIAQAMDLISGQRVRPIDSWRLARGHAALGDCTKALELLDEAETMAGGKITFLKQPGDFLKLKTLCLDSVDNGAEPYVGKRPVAELFVNNFAPEQQGMSGGKITLTVFSLAGLLFAGNLLLKLKQKKVNPQRTEVDAITARQRLPSNSAWGQLSRSFLNEHNCAKLATALPKRVPILVKSTASISKKKVEPIGTTPFLKPVEAKKNFIESVAITQPQTLSVATLASRKALQRLEI